MTPNHLKYIKWHFQKITPLQKPMQQAICGSYKNYFAPKESVTCQNCLTRMRLAEEKEAAK